jgi:hypothetical protein
MADLHVPSIPTKTGDSSSNCFWILNAWGKPMDTLWIPQHVLKLANEFRAPLGRFLLVPQLAEGAKGQRPGVDLGLKLYLSKQTVRK